VREVLLNLLADFNLALGLVAASFGWRRVARDRGEAAVVRDRLQRTSTSATGVGRRKATKSSSRPTFRTPRTFTARLGRGLQRRGLAPTPDRGPLWRPVLRSDHHRLLHTPDISEFNGDRGIHPLTP
jgi:hypothetical protein